MKHDLKIYCINWVLGLEVLEDRRIRQFVILMYKITHNISPPYDECL